MGTPSLLISCNDFCMTHWLSATASQRPFLWFFLAHPQGMCFGKNKQTIHRTTLSKATKQCLNLRGLCLFLLPCWKQVSGCNHTIHWCFCLFCFDVWFPELIIQSLDHFSCFPLGIKVVFKVVLLCSSWDSSFHWPELFD